MSPPPATTGVGARDNPRLKLLRGNRFFLACDTETTDLAPDARVLSLAFVELLPDGLTGPGVTWYFNPGVPSSPRAAKVHRITAEHLHGRPVFADRLGEVTGWLTGPEGREHVLVGHVVQFDAERLHYEYQVAGTRLPPLRLLDTRRLAEAVGLVGTSSLDSLCAALGIARVGAHTASRDAHTTAAAAHQLLSRLAAAPEWTPEQLPTLLEDLIEPFVPRKPRRRARQEPEELTAAHLAAHTADLTQAASRRQALEVCVAERCSMLAYRMEDGITSRSRARRVVEWALQHLETGQLDRRLTGRMLAGVGVALRRCEAPAFAEQVLMDRLLPLLGEWGPCVTDRRYTTRRCGRCLHQAGVCRFVEVARDAVDAVLFDASDPTRQLSRTGVNRFLPGFSPGHTRRGRPPEGLYQRLRRAGELDAAGHGAARVGEYRRDHGDRAWALALLRKAWADGCRTPRLAELLASMTVLDATDRARRDRQHIRDAIDVLDLALQQPDGVLGHSAARLRRRRSWLAARLVTPARPPVLNPRNRRRPSTARPGTPAAIDIS